MDLGFGFPAATGSYILSALRQLSKSITFDFLPFFTVSLCYSPDSSLLMGGVCPVLLVFFGFIFCLPLVLLFEIFFSDFQDFCSFSTRSCWFSYISLASVFSISFSLFSRNSSLSSFSSWERRARGRANESRLSSFVIYIY